jgi:hypothetical protein
VTFFVSFDWFFLKFALSDMNISIPACFQIPFAWKIFFHPFTLSPYLSLSVRCTFCWQQIVESYFFIGELRPLTFRVMVERYVLIPSILLFYAIWFFLTHLLIYLSSKTYSFLCFYSFIYHLLSVCRIPLSIFCSAYLVIVNCFNFCLSW